MVDAAELRKLAQWAKSNARTNPGIWNIACRVLDEIDPVVAGDE